MMYPEYHREITEALLMDARFLVEGEPEFTCLRENLDFYQQFFEASFGLSLLCQSDYAFLQSARDNDTLSRDICIFLGVLCYEVDREGKNIMEELSFSTFAYEDVERLLELSSFREVLEATKSLRDAPSRRNFYHLLARRRLIDKIDDEAFRFTPGHKYFLEFARGVVQEMGERETGDGLSVGGVQTEVTDHSEILKHDPGDKHGVEE
ncbi:MAG: hypothetical protein H6560_23675 [Lewinellaceae bacterium]|nr:hypothetical protein [Lewinellaceae bacterium]